VRKPKISNKLKIISLILLGIIAIAFFPTLADYYMNLEPMLESLGSVGPFIYILLLIMAILIAPIPSAPLAIISGMVFGPLQAFIYTLIGATIGAVLAFTIARFFLREHFKKHFENNDFYKKIKGKKNHNIAYIVFITRLMPQVSFDVVSYLAGLTGISIGIFALVTFFGMIPMVFILTFFGIFLEPYKTILGITLLTIFILYLTYKILKECK